MGTRCALIVANDSYQDPGLRKLRAPTQDARALESVLADPAIGGFSVRVVMNEPESRLRREVARFFAGRAPDDLLLAHFSCHGVKDDSGQLYFATADTELTSLDATAVPAEFVNRHMNRSRSRRVVLLLDCCYSGAFARGMLARAGEDVDLRERFEGRGRIVLTASSAMEYAFEEAELARANGQPSVFTRTLVDGLRTGEADRNRDGSVSVDELYDYIFDEVRKLTPNQTPGRWNFEVQGDLLIARSPTPRPAPLPVELEQAIQHSIAGMRLAAIEELERLLSGAHTGLALAAHEALKLLAEDDSRRVRSTARSVLDAHPTVDTAEPAQAAIAAPTRPPPAISAVAAPPAPSAQVGPQPNPPGASDRPVLAPDLVRLPALPHGAKAPSRTPPTSPSTAPVAPPARPRRLLPLIASILLVVAVTLWIRLTMHDSGELVAGQEFSATAPWHLDVKGSSCEVTISPIGDQGAPRSARGSSYSLQMRISGDFIVKGLTSGCTAKAVEGTGGNVALPLEVKHGSDGAGGDSHPFESLVSAKVAAEGDDCTTTIYDSRDGSQVAQFYGNDSKVVGKGEFYVNSYAGCTIKITAG